MLKNSQMFIYILFIIDVGIHLYSLFVYLLKKTPIELSCSNKVTSCQSKGLSYCLFTSCSTFFYTFCFYTRHCKMYGWMYSVSSCCPWCQPWWYSLQAPPGPPPTPQRRLALRLRTRSDPDVLASSDASAMLHLTWLTV